MRRREQTSCAGAERRGWFLSPENSPDGGSRRGADPKPGLGHHPPRTGWVSAELAAGESLSCAQCFWRCPCSEPGPWWFHMEEPILLQGPEAEEWIWQQIPCRLPPSTASQPQVSSRSSARGGLVRRAA